MTPFDVPDNDEDIEIQCPPTTDNLDQLDVAPPSNVNSCSNIYDLSSQIAFLAPGKLGSWAFYNLGLLCCSPSPALVPFPETASYIGYSVHDADKGKMDYKDLQEFVSYIVKNDFDNPRIVHLSDLQPHHFSPLDIRHSPLYISRVDITQSIIQQNPDGSTSLLDIERTGYVLRVLQDRHNFRPNWILIIFDATTVVQILRNRWGSDSMEELIRHLVRHGIEFRTLAPVYSPIALHFVHQPPSFPPITKRMLDANDYANYVQVRENIIHSPHYKAAYRAGGILWRLAMESVGNLDDIVNNILSGPSQMSAMRGEFFTVNGQRYYDDAVSSRVADIICGTHGFNGRSYWPTVHSWMKKRWGSLSTHRGNLMWNRRDEEWFQKHKAACLAAKEAGQPKTQDKWKKYGTNKHKFDVPFEQYCANFLDRSLSS